MDVYNLSILSSILSSLIILGVFYFFFFRKKCNSLKEITGNYYHFINNVPIGMFRSTPSGDGKFIMVNPEFSLMFGYASVEEIMKVSAKDLYYDPFERIKLSDKLLKQGKIQNDLLKMKKKNGDCIWVEVTASIAKEEENGLCFYGFVKDVTKRKESEEKLKLSELQFRATFEQAAVGIIHAKINGQFTKVNKKFCDIIGYSAEELLKLNFREITYETDLAKELLFVRKLLDNEIQTFSMEKRYIKKDSSLVWVILTVSLVRDENNVPDYFIGVVEDILEKKKLEHELLKSHKLEALGIFAGGVAHDYNNLLTAILGNISLIKSSISPAEEIFQRIEEAEKASIRARDLTQQFLTFAKGGSPVKKTLSIKDLIKDTVSFILSGSNVKCRFSINENLWFTDVDKAQLAQVIQNIVLNSKQAMSEGGNLEVSATNIINDDKNKLLKDLPNGKYLSVVISDTGPGITGEHLSKVFDPFFTTKENGSGLGLSIALSIVSKHGGTILVDSYPGKGSFFTIYLPAAAAEETVLEENNDRNLDFNLSRCKVLIMDDEAMVRDVLTKMLEKMGIEVTATEDGKEAVYKYKEALDKGNFYDIVILDITIPGGMGGEETLKLIKEIDPDVKAIVSSGYSGKNISAEYMTYGFSGIVSKPYQLRELKNTIIKVLKGI